MEIGTKVRIIEDYCAVPSGAEGVVVQAPDAQVRWFAEKRGLISVQFPGYADSFGDRYLLKPYDVEPIGKGN